MAFQQISPTRALIRDGKLAVLKDGNGKAHNFMLFNDVVIWNGPDKGARFLDELRVINASNESTFKLLSNLERHVNLQAENSGDKQSWMDAIIISRDLGNDAGEICKKGSLPDIETDLKSEMASAGVNEEDKTDPANVSWSSVPATPAIDALRAEVFDLIRNEIIDSIDHTSSAFEEYRKKDSKNVVLESLADALVGMKGTMAKTKYEAKDPTEESETEEALEDAWKEVARISGKMQGTMAKFSKTSSGRSKIRVSSSIAALRAKFECDTSVLRDTQKKVQRSGKKINSSESMKSDDPAANIDHPRARDFWIKTFGSKTPICDFKDLKVAYEEEFREEMDDEMVEDLLSTFGLHGPLSQYKDYPIHAKNFGTITDGLGFPFDMSKHVNRDKNKKKGGPSLLEEAQKAEFADIIAIGSEDFVEQYVNSGLNFKLLEKRFEDDNTVLHLAAKRGNVPIFEMIQKKLDGSRKKITVNDVNRHGLAPVHYAAIEGHDHLQEILEKQTSPQLLKERPILHELVRHNKVGRVKGLISMWESIGNEDKVNQKDKWGRTALGVAAKGGNKNMIDSLVDGGAKPSKEDIRDAVHGDNPQALQVLLNASDDKESMLDKDKESPLLHYTAEHGSADMCAVVLDNGASLQDRAAVTGETAFLTAAKCGNIGVVEHCVQVDKAVLDQVDNNGKSALHLSCGETDTEMSCVLVENGADANKTDKDGYTSIMYAARSGETELLDAMVEHAKLDVNQTNDKEETSLCIAAKRGDLELCRALLKAGADPDHPKSKPPVIHAAKAGNVLMLKTLFEAGADPNATSSKSGRAGIHQAALKKSVDSLVTFFENGADINKQDKDGNTALHLSISVGHLEGAQTIIAHGAKTDIQNKKGQTPLHYAITNKRNDILDLLLAQDHDKIGLTVHDYHGEAPIHTAIISKNKYALKKLLAIKGQGELRAKNSKKSYPLTLAADKGRVNAVEQLVAHKVDINCQDSKGRTALAYASVHANVKIAEILLDNGADLTVKDKKGLTPLIATAEKGNEDMVDLLLKPTLEQGLVDETTTDGRTALYTAAYSGHSLILRKLIQNGADPSISSDKGWTPLHAAAYKKRTVCVDELIEHKVDCDPANFEGVTPLCNAAQAGDIDIVIKLIESGAKLEGDKEKWTPLQMAVLHNKTDVAIYLLKKGADVLCENQTKTSAALYLISKPVYDKIEKHPLVVAMWEEHPDLVKNYNRCGRWLCALGRVNMLKHFLEVGGAITKEHMELAAEYNQPKMVEFMSEKFGWEKIDVNEDEQKDIVTADMPERVPKPPMAQLRQLTRMVSPGDHPEGL